MIDDKPSIAELRAELSRWPSDWVPDEDSTTARWTATSPDGEDTEVETDVEDYCVDLAKHIASLHNSAPLLLDIITAAIGVLEAHDSDSLNDDAWQIRCCDARRALRVALAKARP